MSALLQERTKRNKNRSGDRDDSGSKTPGESGEGQSLQSLVESVKRKSAVAEGRTGKRQKL